MEQLESLLTENHIEKAVKATKGFFQSLFYRPATAEELIEIRMKQALDRNIFEKACEVAEHLGENKDLWAVDSNYVFEKEGINIEYLHKFLSKGDIKITEKINKADSNIVFESTYDWDAASQRRGYGRPIDRETILGYKPGNWEQTLDRYYTQAVQLHEKESNEKHLEEIKIKSEKFGL